MATYANNKLPNGYLNIEFRIGDETLKLSRGIPLYENGSILEQYLLKHCIDDQVIAACATVNKVNYKKSMKDIDLSTLLLEGEIKKEEDKTLRKEDQSAFSFLKELK